MNKDGYHPFIEENDIYIYIIKVQFNPSKDEFRNKWWDQTTDICKHLKKKQKKKVKISDLLFIWIYFNIKKCKYYDFSYNMSGC